MSLLSGGLIQPNAVVRIENEVIGQDAEGGTTDTPVTLVDDVSVLITQVDASRTDRLGGEHNVIRGTMTGANASLARVDVRYFVKTSSVYGLTGIYLFPESVSVHGATGEGVMAAEPFYRVKVSSVRTT